MTILPFPWETTRPTQKCAFCFHPAQLQLFKKKKATKILEKDFGPRHSLLVLFPHPFEEYARQIGIISPTQGVKNFSDLGNHHPHQKKKGSIAGRPSGKPNGFHKPCNTWRIVPFSKWLGSPLFISHGVRPFGRGITPFRGLTKWDAPPSKVDQPSNPVIF